MSRMAIWMATGCCLAVLITRSGRAEESPSFISFNLGASEILDSHPQVGGFIEFRPFWRRYGFGAWAGVGLGKDRENYAALGILYEILWGRKWAATASFGGGYYVCNDGIDLGSELEFRSAIETCYRTQNDYRIGLGFCHLSNGGISEINPGMETLYLLFSVPFP